MSHALGPPTFFIAAVALLPTFASAQDVTPGTDFAVERGELAAREQLYSPFVNQGFPQRIFWGDTHVHTSYSWDAGLVGNTLDPDMAYRVAIGRRSHTTMRAGEVVRDELASRLKGEWDQSFSSGSQLHVRRCASLTGHAL